MDSTFSRRDRHLLPVEVAAVRLAFTAPLDYDQQKELQLSVLRILVAHGICETEAHVKLER